MDPTLNACDLKAWPAYGTMPPRSGTGAPVQFQGKMGQGGWE